MTTFAPAHWTLLATLSLLSIGPRRLDVGRDSLRRVDQRVVSGCMAGAQRAHPTVTFASAAGD